MQAALSTPITSKNMLSAVLVRRLTLLHVLGSIFCSTCGFVQPSLVRNNRVQIHHKGIFKSKDNLDLDGDGSTSLSPEKSRMADYVSDFLKRDESAIKGDTPAAHHVPHGDTTTATHLIAIPLGSCHELLLELESVQRAILYHCPILADACIPGSAMRLPLLYVNAPQSNTALVTDALSETVSTLVQKHIYSASQGEDEEKLNEEGFLPLAVTFESLEIDGANNNVLSTVGQTGEDGITKLQSLVLDLKKAVEDLGWGAVLPADPHGSTGGAAFRPRVPFMELPKEFDDNLSRLKDPSTEIDEEDFEFLSPSEGGNGISPIFWCEWWHDVFGRNIRLKEICIYPRSGALTMVPSELSYADFYLPFSTIALPDGNAAMLRTEKKFQEYQDGRLREDGGGSTSVAELTAPTAHEETQDVLLSKTTDRLERLYIDSRTNPDVEADEDATIEVAETDTVDEIFKQKVEASPDDFIDDWMKNRIKQAIETQESEKARMPEEKKEMPPIAENPIFKAYKEGTLSPKKQNRTSNKKDLGPYPSREHFAGIWRVTSSPTGFPVEKSTNESSENLILRLDGTIAGGPILDVETRQKAAGGTWRILEGGNGEVSLRVRLLIPPKKERVLEMVGLVNRLNVSSDIPMASRAFGIPHLEAMAMDDNSDMEAFMACEGDVFLEDRVAKTKSREYIGGFSLTKLHGPKDPGEYTITIPKSSW